MPYQLHTSQQGTKSLQKPQETPKKDHKNQHLNLNTTNTGLKTRALQKDANKRSRSA